MNFQLPYSWLKDYVAIPKEPRQLARELSVRGPSVERVIHTKYEWTPGKVVVAEIIDIKKHPNADKLNIATVTTGKGKERTIVCGAPNIAVGQRVPLALVGAVLPSNFTIQEREVRGIKSEGMLCSARELGIHDDHVGILILHADSPLGMPLESLGQASDYIYDVEPTTNRPDIASVIGVAREVCAITGQTIKLPKLGKLPKKGRSNVAVKVEDKKNCRRFMGVVLENVVVGASSWLMQERLVRAGIRPINAIVDITNYVMLEYGQPMHAYDLDKLGNSVTVRRAKKGESILALDGKNYQLSAEHLVIAGKNGPVGIAGIMGGELTGVTTVTKRVFLEAATWDAVLARRMSRDLLLMSEASQLYEKGLSVDALPLALARAVDLAKQQCQASVSGGVIDLQQEKSKAISIRFPLSEIKRIVGTTVGAREAGILLKRLGFGVRGSGAVLSVSVPYWRDHDVLESVDLVEEIARLNGYHTLSTVLPEATLAHLGTNDMFDRETFLRRELVKIGFTELISNSFVSERLVKAAGGMIGEALQVENPLSSDSAYMRPSLLPSLLMAVEKNQASFAEQFMFEIGNVYASGHGKGLDGYRIETFYLSGVITQRRATDEELYRKVRGVVEHLANVFGIVIDSDKSAPPQPFSATASNSIKIGDGVGAYGLIHPAAVNMFGVGSTVAAFSIPLIVFTKDPIKVHQYQATPKFPAVQRDLAIVVGAFIDYTRVVSSITRVSSLVESVALVDTYQAKALSTDKLSLTVRIIFRAANRTLEAQEVQQAEKKILEALATEFGITLRS